METPLPAPEHVPQRKAQFGLQKLVIIVAVFALLFGWLRSTGVLGMIWEVVLGSSSLCCSSLRRERLYGVEPRTLIQAVKRNRGRFPPDFIQLNKPEFANLKSQIVISSWGGARRATPYAFTENGVAMLSSVLNSERAIRVNVEIMRTFTRLRRTLASHADLARKLDDLEKKYDVQFKIVFDAIRELMAPAAQPKKGRIGFHLNPNE